MRLPRVRFTVRGLIVAVAYLALVIASMVVDSEALPALATTATLGLLLWAAVAAWLRRSNPAWCFGFALFGAAAFFGGGFLVRYLEARPRRPSDKPDS